MDKGNRHGHHRSLLGLFAGSMMLLLLAGVFLIGIRMQQNQLPGGIVAQVGDQKLGEEQYNDLVNAGQNYGNDAETVKQSWEELKRIEIANKEIGLEIPDESLNRLRDGFDQTNLDTNIVLQKNLYKEATELELKRKSEGEFTGGVLVFDALAFTGDRMVSDPDKLAEAKAYAEEVHQKLVDGTWDFDQAYSDLVDGIKFNFPSSPNNSIKFSKDSSYTDLEQVYYYQDQIVDYLKQGKEGLSGVMEYKSNNINSDDTGEDTTVGYFIAVVDSHTSAQSDIQSKYNQQISSLTPNNYLAKILNWLGQSADANVITYNNSLSGDKHNIKGANDLFGNLAGKYRNLNGTTYSGPVLWTVSLTKQSSQFWDANTSNGLRGSFNHNGKVNMFNYNNGLVKSVFVDVNKYNYKGLTIPTTSNIFDEASGFNNPDYCQGVCPYLPPVNADSAGAPNSLVLLTKTGDMNMYRDFGIRYHCNGGQTKFIVTARPATPQNIVASTVDGGKVLGLTDHLISRVYAEEAGSGASVGATTDAGVDVVSGANQPGHQGGGNPPTGEVAEPKPGQEPPEVPEPENPLPPVEPPVIKMIKEVRNASIEGSEFVDANFETLEEAKANAESVRFHPGDTIEYKITVNNEGPGFAREVTVTDDDLADFADWNEFDGYLGDLAEGESKELLITGRIKSDYDFSQAADLYQKNIANTTCKYDGLADSVKILANSDLISQLTSQFGVAQNQIDDYLNENGLTDKVSGDQDCQPVSDPAHISPKVVDLTILKQVANLTETPFLSPGTSPYYLSDGPIYYDADSIDNAVSFGPSEEIEYRIEIINNGPDEATSISFTDPDLPDELVDWESDGWINAETGETVSSGDTIFPIPAEGAPTEFLWPEE
ncbi:DUF11 domain-containing protein, partial [Candidatus Saccharibacteria bacterium]|nr:DUF11 domain-containing protein [Candidatus Saccharibacteria bacterium]